MKKFIVYLIVAVAILVIVGTVFVYIAPHIGWSFDKIVSRSMEPFVPVGSLIVTKPVDIGDIEEGDVILFYPLWHPESLMAHRVSEVNPGPPLNLSTQGDANLKPDPNKVYQENFYGKVIITIPGMGGYIDFIKDTKGFILQVAVPSLVVLAAYL